VLVAIWEIVSPLAGIASSRMDDFNEPNGLVISERLTTTKKYAEVI